jgi:hypothetical protein
MPFRSSWIFLLGEGISVLHPESVFYIFLAIDFGSSFLEVIECPYVVKASRVVLVVVGEEDGVEMTYVLTQHLLPEVRSCIDEELHAFVFD